METLILAALALCGSFVAFVGSTIAAAVISEETHLFGQSLSRRMLAYAAGLLPDRLAGHHSRAWAERLDREVTTLRRIVVASRIVLEARGVARSSRTLERRQGERREAQVASRTRVSVLDAIWLMADVDLWGRLLLGRPRLVKHRGRMAVEYNPWRLPRVLYAEARHRRPLADLLLGPLDWLLSLFAWIVE